ncbi:hypothetical protein [Rufibacter sp. XAAS-G3-1]|uniref:hypothetical protein n=1 Tax=Rufibacter sp. XAAS-G3-1 TaxID=2729134 RepID=UPI0015E7A64B|nr:hypothetical protein [Rufibacter sp. XAAS-G3-1]
MLEPISYRTFERDKKDIFNCYGVNITFCPRQKGYYLDQPTDEDLSNFHQFIQLMERSERLAFLTHSSDALRTSQYLLLEDFNCTSVVKKVVPAESRTVMVLALLKGNFYSFLSLNT